MSPDGGIIHPPGFDTILGALRMVVQFLADLEAEVKKDYPKVGPELDAILAKLQVASAMTAELQKLVEAVAVLKTGRTPVSPDDIDL